MIAGIAAICCMVLLGIKLVVDSTEFRYALQFSKVLTWLTIPLALMFFANLIVRAAEEVSIDAPDWPLFF